MSDAHWAVLAVAHIYVLIHLYLLFHLVRNQARIGEANVTQNKQLIAAVEQIARAIKGR